VCFSYFHNAKMIKLKSDFTMTFEIVRFVHTFKMRLFHLLNSLVVGRNLWLILLSKI
jgi:hypothetical protein